ncbi:hypothetical protein JW905_05815 [bacterium]|nr:hypothetical protein [candidate division CSSED10-310 bacterium]
MLPDNVKLFMGGRGLEEEVPCHWSSPTFVVDKAWEKVKEVGRASLDAYMSYCRSFGFKHSYLLGLDILITGVIGQDRKSVVDIRPTILEGPCCNSYPACPNFYPSRLYARATHEGLNLDSIDWEVHPTKIRDEIIGAFQAIWEARGNPGKPVVAVLTRPYPESEEETAHVLMLERLGALGYKAFRITPDEVPSVKSGKLHVHGIPIDICYRRIERVHVPMFYGWPFAMDVVYHCPNTVFFNPWEIDDLRSKTIEEQAFRQWEWRTGKSVSRPVTLLGKEITRENVHKMIMGGGGFALKKWNSTGGKGVFLHTYEPMSGAVYDKLYKRYDGRHMVLMTKENLEEHLAVFDDFQQDAAIQQMRTIDARAIGEEERLVYDTRINVLYNELDKEWRFISGMSRTVPCGPTLENGNSLLTNVSSGAHMSPLVIGHTKGGNTEGMIFGPLLQALMAGKTETVI